MRKTNKALKPLMTDTMFYEMFTAPSSRFSVTTRRASTVTGLVRRGYMERCVETDGYWYSREGYITTAGIYALHKEFVRRGVTRFTEAEILPAYIDRAHDEAIAEDRLRYPLPVGTRVEGVYGAHAGERGTVIRASFSKRAGMAVTTVRLDCPDVTDGGELLSTSVADYWAPVVEEPNTDPAELGTEPSVPDVELDMTPDTRTMLAGAYQDGADFIRAILISIERPGHAYVRTLDERAGICCTCHGELARVLVWNGEYADAMCGGMETYPLHIHRDGTSSHDGREVLPMPECWYCHSIQISTRDTGYGYETTCGTCGESVYVDCGD